MALTDREIIKEKEAGVRQSFGLAGTPKAATAAIHSRTYVVNRNFATATGLENAETAVAEVALFTVIRPCRVASAKIVNQTTVAENATDSAYITLGKSTAGAASTTFAFWNTGAVTAAAGGIAANGGALTKWVPATLGLAPNADATLAAGDVVTYTKTATLTGGIVDGAIVVDVEEI
jgi:hypothetical protein